MMLLLKKRTVFVALLCFSIFSVINAQTYYYYYNNKKIKLFPDSLSFGIMTKDTNELKLALSKIEYIDYKNFFSVKTLNQQLYYCKIKTTCSKFYGIIKKNIEKDASLIPCFKTQKKIEIGLTNRFYVQLKSNSDTNLLRSFAKEKKIEIIEKIPYMEDWYVLSCPIDHKINALEFANLFYETGLFATTEPEFVYNNILTSNDIYYSNQWGLHNAGQYGGRTGMDINVEPAWQYTKGQGVKVAVFDQGIDINHPDISANIYSSGFDAETGTSPSQERGDHGTACAGIIGAVENNIGIVGVAPQSKLVPISLKFNTYNTPYQIAMGFNWARENEVDIISNSWGGYDTSYIIESAINRALNEGRNGKGCVVIFASGNDNDTNIKYPNYANPDYIVVGAISPCGERKNPNSCDGECWGSCYGNALDVVAPGVLIPTTDGTGYYGYNPNEPIHKINCGRIVSSDYSNKDYTIWFNGTSAACPHVAGVAALVLSVNPNLTGQQVRDIIESTARKVRTDLYTYTQNSSHPNGTWNDSVGYGLVDAYAAVKKAMTYLYIRDTVTDNGTVPSTVHYAYNSPDIWTTDMNDIICNPTGGEYCKVCVRVHNKSNYPSSGNEKLIVNWAKARLS